MEKYSNCAGNNDASYLHMQAAILVSRKECRYTSKRMTSLM
jgi:hypothetical protein